MYTFFTLLGLWFLAYLITVLIGGWRMKRQAEAAPRIRLDEVKPLWDQLESEARPFAMAHVVSDVDPNPFGSRIGGAPLALSAEAEWPVSQWSGRPMVLLAQINFSELPALEDFPTTGILQVFTSFEGLPDGWGCERVIFWDPHPNSERLLEIPEAVQEKRGKHEIGYFSEKARRVGLSLDFEEATAKANPLIWPYIEEGGVFFENRLPENDEVAEVIASWNDRADEIYESYGTHWIGGYPRFVQADVRESHPEHQSLDRILLHIGPDVDVDIADSGEANLMISRENLLKRDFDKAVLTWDSC